VPSALHRAERHGLLVGVLNFRRDALLRFTIGERLSIALAGGRRDGRTSRRPEVRTDHLLLEFPAEAVEGNEFVLAVDNYSAVGMAWIPAIKSIHLVPVGSGTP